MVGFGLTTFLAMVGLESTAFWAMARFKLAAFWAMVGFEPTTFWAMLGLEPTILSRGKVWTHNLSHCGVWTTTSWAMVGFWTHNLLSHGWVLTHNLLSHGWVWTHNLKPTTFWAMVGFWTHNFLSHGGVWTHTLQSPVGVECTIFWAIDGARCLFSYQPATQYCSGLMTVMLFTLKYLWNLIIFSGKSDPFVEIELLPSHIFKNPQSKKTKVKEKTLHPLFDETFTL